jgi:hypothetical protein
MHCEYETYVLQNRVLNLQFPAFAQRGEHKLRRDILKSVFCVALLKSVFCVALPQ